MSTKKKQSTNYHPKTTPRPKPPPPSLRNRTLPANDHQPSRRGGYFEAAPPLYNALLGKDGNPLPPLRANARWQQPRLLPHSDKQARTAAFAALRKEFG